MKYFDLHCDTPYEIWNNGYSFAHEKLSVNPKFSGLFSRWIQCSAIWIRDDANDPFILYRQILHSFLEARSAYSEKSYQTILSVEGGALLEEDIDRIDILFSDRIRMLTLTWNGENTIAGGTKSDKCLTRFGKRVILRMNDKKMICDLAHLNDKSFYGAYSYAFRPIVSHTCCRALCNHPRNLTDEQLKLIAEKNGLVGLCFYPDFLGGINVFERFSQHLCHCLELGLENHIAIGSDFDGAKMSPQLCRVGQIADLYAFLLKKSFSVPILNQLFYGNACNFFSSL